MYDKIISLLTQNQLSFSTLEHEATLTSEASADARGEDISIGGKALLMKVGDGFGLFVLSAALKIDSKTIKKYCEVKKLRFATREELIEMTGLVPGSVPPFGRPLLDFDLYVDESILRNEKIAFNAGSLTQSVVMKVEDYLKVASPIVFNFGKV